MQFCWVMKSGMAFQMNSKTIRRLVSEVTCPFFASPPPQISQSSEIFSWCCKIHVLMLGALQKSTALSTLETVSKRKGFFPPTAMATNGITVIPSIPWGWAYHKGPWTRKKNDLSLCHKQSAEWKGSLHLEEFKEAFGTALKTKREDQTGGEEEEKVEEILRITEAQLEKLPEGEKAPQLARKKCSDVLYPALRSRRQWGEMNII